MQPALVFVIVVRYTFQLIPVINTTAKLCFPSENVQDRPTEYTEKHGIFGLRVRHNHFIREIFATMPPIIGISFPVIPVCPVV